MESKSVSISFSREDDSRPILSGGANTIEVQSNWTIVEGLDLTGRSSRCFCHLAGTTIQDFVYYLELNAGDATVDDDAVAEGIWKDGAASLTVSAASSVGRAIERQVDGAAPHDVDPPSDAENVDWMQYSPAVGGTPGRWNDPATDFLDGFESGGLLR